MEEYETKKITNIKLIADEKQQQEILKSINEKDIHECYVYK